MKEFRLLFFYPNSYLMGIAPGNIAMLSACLKEAGISVRLFDCTHYKIKKDFQDEVRTKLGHVKRTNIEDYINLKITDIFEDFVKVVDDYKPDLIAATLIDGTINFTFRFLEKIADRNIPVVVGGVGATFLYERIFKSGLVDYVCIGEGEGAIVDLCLALKNKRETSCISNIYTIKDGNIVKNSLRKLVNLDNLPIPDFSIYDYDRFYRPFRGRVVRMLQVDLDRGCPFSCTYCAAPTLRRDYDMAHCGYYYRMRNFDKVFEELKILIEKHDINCLWISAETLLAMPQKKFTEFAIKYIQEIDLPFWCQSRLDTFTDGKLKLLQNMGCEAMSVGLEHGSERIRYDLLNKKINNKTILDAFNLISNYDINMTVNTMIGLPDETREDVFESIELNRQIRSILGKNYTSNVFTFIPFSGTFLRKLCIQKGYVKEDMDVSMSFFDDSMLTMPSLSKQEIRGLEKTFALYVKLDKSLWPKIKITEQNNEESNIIFNELVQLSKAN